MVSSERRRSGQEEGLTLVGVLVMVAASSIFLAYAAQTWEAELWRDREKELLFRCEQYKTGIETFYSIHKRLPTKLEELVELEPRSIRRLYKDPMTGGDWQLVPGMGPQGPCNVATALQKEPDEGLDTGPGKRSQSGFSEGPGRRSRQQMEGAYICGVTTTSKRDTWFHQELNMAGGMSGIEAAEGEPGMAAPAAGVSGAGLCVANISPPRPQGRSQPRSGARPPGTPGARPGARGRTGRSHSTRPGQQRPSGWPSRNPAQSPPRR